MVPDLRVASEPAFSSISVTAEQWVPMAEVKEAALLPWLERKQAQGYTLLGLEQVCVGGEGRRRACFGTVLSLWL